MIDAIRKFILQFDARRVFFKSLNNRHRLLDIGCGQGKNAFEIRELHPDIEIHGVDILPQSDVPSVIRYKAVNLDKGALPYPDES